MMTDEERADFLMRTRIVGTEILKAGIETARQDVETINEQITLAEFELSTRIDKEVTR